MTSRRAEIKKARLQENALFVNPESKITCLLFILRICDSEFLVLLKIAPSLSYYAAFVTDKLLATNMRPSDAQQQRCVWLWTDFVPGS